MSLSVPQRNGSSYAYARVFVAAILFLLTLQSQPARAQATPQQSLKLERIEFKGLERVKEDEALEKSGLKVGQTVTIDELDTVANNLLASGLFKNLSYSVKGTTDKAVLIFTVIEQTWSMPVAFDNFVWFTDEELKAAIKRKVPAFDGTAPEAGNVTEQIKQALQDLLREHKIEGTVEYTLSADASGRKVEHLFGVKGPGLRVCKINYQGARALSEEALVVKSGGIFDNDYSRAYVSGFVESNLVPLYWEKGYLRASFSPPKVKPESTAECENGLAVSMYVDEGSIYVWDKAAWDGAQALTPEELNAALGMRNREVANVVKIDKGVASVRKAYARKGFLLASVRAAQEFDDTNRSVAYHFLVEEGPQYHMGDLTIEGLSEADTNNLRGRWSILHGDVYNADYPEQFIKKNVTEFLNDAMRAGHQLPAMKIKPDIRQDAEKHTVNVTLVFKPDTSQQKPAGAPNP